VYFGVSVVAWSNQPQRELDDSLDDDERAGLAIWREKNCQVCHQLYGFGGFLGPDLTNVVVEGRSDQEFGTLLSQGYKKMPAFDLDEDQQHHLLSFLRAVDRSGRSLPPPLPAERELPPTEHHRELAFEWSRHTGVAMPAPARRGLDVWTRSECGKCHQPFTTGNLRAPDLAAASIDRSADSIQAVITKGRGNMPAAQFTRGEFEDLSAWLEWLAGNRDELVRIDLELTHRAEFTFRELPWFEYK
jgi:mono/diheme cytochrome c family protein